MEEQPQPSPKLSFRTISKALFDIVLLMIIHPNARNRSWHLSYYLKLRNTTKWGIPVIEILISSIDCQSMPIQFSLLKYVGTNQLAVAWQKNICYHCYLYYYIWKQYGGAWFQNLLSRNGCLSSVAALKSSLSKKETCRTSRTEIVNFFCLFISFSGARKNSMKTWDCLIKCSWVY